LETPRSGDRENFPLLIPSKVSIGLPTNRLPLGPDRSRCPTFPLGRAAVYRHHGFHQSFWKTRSLEGLGGVGGRKNEALIPPIAGEFGSDRDVTPDDVFDLSFLVPSCSFEKEGVYQVLFRIGDEVLGRRTLPARLIPSTNAAPAPPA
jgi:hypothetical protein